MYTKRVIEPHIIWYFTWRPLLCITSWSASVYFLYHDFGFRQITLPFLPIATVATAVAFYLGFKNNSSYDRLWEARKIWGEITNISRSMVSDLMAVMPPGHGAEVKEFVYRQIAHVNMLRIQLRRRNVWDDESYDYTRMSKNIFKTLPFEQESDQILHSYLSREEADDLMNKRNIALEILTRQAKHLTQFKRKNWIDGYEHAELLKLCNELCAQLGKAERIKSFPFPRQYAFFSEAFVYIFVSLVPFGLIGEFDKLGSEHDWLTIPFSMLIAWVFVTMEKVGDTSENPFEGSMNDVPMTTICRNIEIDLKSMMGETDIPQPTPMVHHVLM